MDTKEKFLLPVPLINQKEEELFIKLDEKYENIIKPGVLTKAGRKVGSIIPSDVKKTINVLGNSIQSNEFYLSAMKVATDGFKEIQEKAAKYTISEKEIIKAVNKECADFDIVKIEEICFARSYDIQRAANKSKGRNKTIAFFEGGATGFAGFAGLPANFVFSTFLYFRAVQVVAMYYGYDVKHKPEELEIAANVYTKALAPKDIDTSEMGNIIGKIMVMSEITAIKQTAAKSWTEMAKAGGIRLLLTQLRALANAAAKKAIENAGKKQLEKTIFDEVFKQIGKKLTLKNIEKSIPVIGAGFSAFFDIGQMKQIVDYADIFYSKRFIAEKEVRINQIFGNLNEDEVKIIDVEMTSLNGD